VIAAGHPAVPRHGPALRRPVLLPAAAPPCDRCTSGTSIKGADLIEREGITNFTATPAITGDLVAFSRGTGRKFPTLISSVGGGGASRAPEQVRAIDAVFEKAMPATGWGMTETNAIGVGIAAADYLRKPESSGRVSAVLDVRVVDESGKPVPTGQRGELQIRGASIMRGYYNGPTPTQRVRQQ
jgi:long-chain acyl-CoA synthetase